MARQLVGIGSSANDGTGDTLRDGIDKVNDNFIEIYGKIGDGTTIGTFTTTGITSTGDFTIDGSADIILDADGGDVFFKDGGTTFGSATNTSGNLIIKSGTTTALTFSGANVTAAGVVTGTTVEATGDTSSGDNAAIGYTSAEGLILTGQGSTNDITIKNDADTAVVSIPTGGTDITVAGVVTATGFTIGSAAITETELEIIDGATVTTTELNLLDGNTSVGGSITVGDSDGFIVNDGGTMKTIPASDIKTYAAGSTPADDITTGDAAVTISTSSGNITIDAAANNSDIIFKGTDATSDITMLTLDGSEAGAAIFNSAITGGGLLTTGGNIVIPDAGNIGSASDTNAITISSGGVVAVTATTASSNSTTGALTVGGGAGVAADLSVGDDLRLISDAAVLSFGADSDVTLTHVADTGILLNSTMAIQFNDASQSINAPSNAILDINATDEIELNATLVDVNANLDVSGTVTSGGVVTGTGFTIGSAAINEAELEIIDGATVTTTELNLLDGNTSVGGSITLADADGLIVNDAGTMKTIPASDVKTYVGGSKLVFLAENDVTGGVHLTTAFTSTHITSAYERYLITFQDVDFNNDNVTFYAQISVDNGSNYKTADYRTAGFYTEYNGSSANTATLSTAAYFMWATAVANEATHTLNGHIWLINPSNSATFPQAYAEIGHYAEDNYSRRMIQHGVWSGGATAFNNIKFAPSASVFNEGKFVLYGVKNS